MNSARLSPGMAWVLFFIIAISLPAVTATAQKGKVDFKPEVISQTGHTDLIQDIVQSHSGKLFITKDNRSLLLWDIKSMRVLRSLAGGDYDSELLELYFSKNDSLVVMVTESKTRIWRITESKPVFSFVREKMALSNDSQLIARVLFHDSSKIEIIKTRDLPHVFADSIPIWRKVIARKSKEEVSSISFSNSNDILVYNTNTELRSLDLKTNLDAKIIRFAGGENIKLVSGTNLVIIYGESEYLIADAITKKVHTRGSFSKISISDSGLFFSIDYRDTISLFSVPQKKLVKRIPAHREHISGFFGSSGIFSFQRSEDVHDSIMVFNAADGKLLRTIERVERETNAGEEIDEEGRKVTYANTYQNFLGQSMISISSNDQQIVFENGGTIEVHPLSESAETKNRTLAFVYYLTRPVESCAFQQGGGRIRVNNFMLDCATGTNTGKIGNFWNASFSASGRSLVFGTPNDKDEVEDIVVWNSQSKSKKVLFSLPRNAVGHVAIDTLGSRFIYTKNDCDSLFVHDVKNRFTRKMHFPGPLNKIETTGDGQFAVLSSHESISLVDLNKLNIVFQEKGVGFDFNNGKLTKDGKYFYYSDSVGLHFYNHVSGENQFLEGINSVVFADHNTSIGQLFVSSYIYGGSGADILEVVLYSKDRNADFVSQYTHWIEFEGMVDLDWKENLYVISGGNRLTFYDLNTGTLLLTYRFVDYENNWLVTHPSGLFDASPGAMNKLYFVQGLDIIDFNQLKERYYEPGLWKKIMSREKLRDVETFTNVELPPEITLAAVDLNGNLPVTLINREAGIGKVSVFINGKEILADARKSESDRDKKTLTLGVSLKNHPYLLPGKENVIEVRAWNGGGWIVSQPASVKYVAPKARDSRGVEVEVADSKKEVIAPNIYILASGVSDYTGDAIDLKYAAKDAESASGALAIGAKRMFGTEKSFVYLLSSAKSPPTKKNILATFKTIASKATSSDIFVVYLSGHGINWGGHEGDFYYLTSDAYSTSLDAYNDPAIRDNATISSKELVELFKTVPALKQVLIIDACASGRLVENLITKRDISSSTLRALDRMKDRTGMHIITGCAADAVSYEASRYGQGVLTYSLIEAIKGAKLRDNEFIDVNQLFQYARDRVPVLAQGIGGIQSPQIFSPNGAQSFDIGKMIAEDKEQVKLAKTRPLYTKSVFLDRNEISDVLGLSKSVDQRLNEISSRGESSQLIFMDVDEFPEACKITGLYETKNGKLHLNLKRACGKEVRSFALEGSDQGTLLEAVLKKIENQ